MTKNIDSLANKMDDFLSRYRFTKEEFEKTGLDWALLVQIYEHHIGMINELQSTAEYILQRLQLVKAVHSLKVRIKDAEHLIAKIIRKKMESSDLMFDLTCYQERITDLIGIRALHLFKDDWRTIHEFINNTWELLERPTANIRVGDPEALINAFTEANCVVKEHPFGYRSIHYLIKSQPAKCTHFAELQVRTIFEEGWSEIDHRVRYPRQSDDPYLAQFLTIFNRLAGSADEMGTFIKALSSYLQEQSEKVKERDHQIAIKEAELKKAVSQLKIGTEEKKDLEKQIDALRKSSLQNDSIYSNSFINLPPTTAMSSGSIFSDNLVYVNNRICSSCGKSYMFDWNSIASVAPVSHLSENLCQDCRKKLLGY